MPIEMLMMPIRWSSTLKPLRAAAPLRAAISIGPDRALLAASRPLTILPRAAKVWRTMSML